MLYDGASAQVSRPPQQLGAQTAEVLAELGFSETEIRALAQDNVITTGQAP